MSQFDIRLQCLPGQDPVVTTVHVLEGWSTSAKERCIYVQADNANGATRSEVVALGYPADCAPIPEPPALMGAAVGFVALAMLWRLKRGY